MKTLGLLTLTALAALLAFAPPSRAETVATKWAVLTPENFLYGSAADSSGDILAVGNSGPDTLFTAKYAGESHALLWRNDDATTTGQIARVVVNAGGYLFVIASALNTPGTSDIYTAKYRGTDGVKLWEARFHTPGGTQGIGRAIGLDGDGNVIVAGQITNSTGHTEGCALKYRATDGGLLWERRVAGAGGSAAGDDALLAMAIDGGGNVAVAGYVDFGNSAFTYGIFYVARLRGSDGAVLWEKQYSGLSQPGQNGSVADGVGVDVFGNVTATGVLETDSLNDARYTAKYAVGDGSLMWENRENLGGVIPNFNGQAFKLDSGGNVFVATAWVTMNSDTFHPYVVKYAPNGTKLWELSNGASLAESDLIMTLDGAGNPIVAGTHHPGSIRDNLILTKYRTSDGAVLWETSPDSNGASYAEGLAVDALDNVYVSGFAYYQPGTGYGFLRKFGPPDAAPTITTTAAMDVSYTSATLHATVNPNGLTTEVEFSLFENAVGTTLIPAGRSAVGASFVKSGLAPHTTYYVFSKGMNLAGITQAPFAPSVFFTTLNHPPSAGADTAMSAGEAVDIAVLANDTDLDSDALSITSAGPAQHGSVSFLGGTVTYTPDASYTGTEFFNYTISDGFGGTGTGTVSVSSGTPILVLLHTGASSGGDAVPGEPATPVATTFTSFGVPFVNDFGTVAFSMKMRTPTGTKAALFANNAVAVRAGDAATDALGIAVNGVTFASFRDPVLAGDGTLGFLAKVAGVGVTSANDYGAWIKSSLGLRQIAREGDTPAGAPLGAALASFTSFVVQGTGTHTAAFTGKLVIGLGGVTTADDEALWSWSEMGGVSLVLREGSPVQGAANPTRLVKSFKALVSASGTPGQARGAAQDGTLTFLVTFSDGTTSLVDAGGFGGLTEFAKTGNAIAPSTPALIWDALRPPSTASSGLAAWLGTLRSGSGGVTSANAKGIFLDDNFGTLDTIVRLGDFAPGMAPPGTPSVFFASLNDPALAPMSRTVAFFGKARGAVTPADDTGVWWKIGGGTSPLQLVLRENATPPGAPVGSQIKSFASLATTLRGPLLTTQLRIGPGGVTTANDVRFFASDNAGTLHAVLAEGQSIPATPQPKIVKTFTVLAKATGSTGVRRSFTADGGQIVVRIYFTDRTQALAKIYMP